MKQLYLLKSLVLTIVLFLSVTILNAATITTAGSGNWNSTNLNAPWPGGTVPSATDDVIIANSHTVTITANATCASLTINSGAGLIINAGEAVTVSGTLTNNAGTSGLVIKSDATGDGQLITNSSVSGTVELDLTGGPGTYGNSYHYFVPPVESMTIYTTLTPLEGNVGITEAKVNLGLTYFSGDLLAYDETKAITSKEAGWQYFDGFGNPPTTPFSSLVNSKGYNIYLSNDDKITFTGTLNSTELSFNLTHNTSGGNASGWNLVGNPYPCNYDLSTNTVLTGTSDKVDNTVYFTKDGGYAYYNVGLSTGSTGYTAIVPPMQGFFVHITGTGTLNASLTLPVASKTTVHSQARAKGANSSEAGSVEKIKLVLSSSTLSDEAVVCLIDKATTGFDGNYDAYKLFGTNANVPYIYTELNSIKYAINSLAGPVTTPVIVPVTAVLNDQGTYNIGISEFESLDGINVVLKHGTVETKLGLSTSYTFTSAAGTYTDFQLVFGSTATGVEIPKPAVENLKTWYSNDFLYINCPSDITAGNRRLIIYDIQGKPVYDNSQVYLTTGQTIQLPLRLLRGIYVARIVVNDQPFVSKIIVL